MITLLNYANGQYRDSQRKNSRTGKSAGGFDRVLSYGPRDIDPAFYAANKAILDQVRGNGYWLWKPYFINRTLLDLPEDNWLFYCDSGSYFVHSVHPLIDLAETTGSSILTFEDRHPERKYAKRDALLLMDADRAEILDTNQRIGGFSLWRNTAFTRQFTSDWLRFATDERILTDLPNTLGQANHPGFEDSRHDQTIYSILAKQHGIPAYRDPSQWGNDRTEEFPNSPYPQLIELTRQRNIPLRTQVKRRVKKWLGYG